MQFYGSFNILWHCPSFGWEWKLTFSCPVATAEFSKFADILSAAIYTQYAIYTQLRFWGPSPSYFANFSKTHFRWLKMFYTVIQLLFKASCELNKNTYKNEIYILYKILLLYRFHQNGGGIKSRAICLPCLKVFIVPSWWFTIWEMFSRLFDSSGVNILGDLRHVLLISWKLECCHKYAMNMAPGL